MVYYLQVIFLFLGDNGHSSNLKVDLFQMYSWHIYIIAKAESRNSSNVIWNVLLLSSSKPTFALYMYFSF